jgi:DNA processing protein
MHQLDPANNRGWIALNMARFTWPALHTQFVRHLSTPDTIQRLCQGGITPLEPLLPGLSEKLAAIQRSHALSHELTRLQAARMTVLTIVDPHYPQSLRWIPDPPLVLYTRGTLRQEDSLAVAVVGSRRPSNYGKLMAQRLSTELVQHGFTVVSGLARGIDSLAHQGALQAGGRTVAVLGSGMNVIYPPENRRLCETISDTGVVMSEFPLDTKPDRWNFPRRNRIISGLALGTLVVEAAANSGALHTARHALEQGREVFAVPGRIDVPNSRGTHSLIKQGAKLVEGINDILAEFPEAVQASACQQQSALTCPAKPQTTADLSAEEAQLLALIQPEETHIDALIQASQLPAHVVASILVTLELRGLIRQFPGKFFARM